jgi:short-subunit dehydrogenase
MNKAIIVGATSGIGRALAVLLTDNNYMVGITGRRSDKLKTLSSSNPDKNQASSFDISSSGSLKKLDELVAKLGGLDLLVFSAGVGELNDNLDTAIELDTIDLNVNSFTNVVGWAYHLFKEQGYGLFLGITSVAGLRGNGHAPAYNASKAYQINYLEGLQHKVSKENLSIYFTDVRPGFVDTAMAKGEGLFWVAPTDKAAKQIFDLIKRKQNMGYVTKRWRLISIILRVVPKRILMKI